MAVKSQKLRPKRIEWFDAQDKRVNDCQAESPAASVKNCTLMVGVLTKDKVGNYTCRTRNSYNHCWTKTIQVNFQGN